MQLQHLRPAEAGKDHGPAGGGDAPHRPRHHRRLPGSGTGEEEAGGAANSGAGGHGLAREEGREVSVGFCDLREEDRRRGPS